MRSSRKCGGIGPVDGGKPKLPLVCPKVLTKSELEDAEGVLDAYGNGKPYPGFLDFGMAGATSTGEEGRLSIEMVVVSDPTTGERRMVARKPNTGQD